jgi:hypothetical protein
MQDTVPAAATGGLWAPSCAMLRLESNHLVGYGTCQPVLVNLSLQSKPACMKVKAVNPYPTTWPPSRAAACRSATCMMVFETIWRFYSTVHKLARRRQIE